MRAGVERLKQSQDKASWPAQATSRSVMSHAGARGVSRRTTFVAAAVPLPAAAAAAAVAAVAVVGRSVFRVSGAVGPQKRAEHEEATAAVSTSDGNGRQRDR